MIVGRMEGGCIQENDTGIFEDATGGGGIDLERDLEPLQEVRASTARREGPVAMLGHLDAPTRRDERGRGRDVERGELAPTRPARVHGTVGMELDRDHRLLQSSDPTGDLGGRLAP